MTDGFRGLHLDGSYDTTGDPLRRFYVPVLQRAVAYDRVAGYFFSSSFATAAAGMARFIANEGIVRLLVGAQLTAADTEALQGRAGLDETLERRLLGDFDLNADTIARHRYEVIAWLVRRGRLTIRVGLPCDSNGVPRPADTPQAHHYFHSKWGVLADGAGDRVAFEGSVNESAAGWQHNFESFSVYRSWECETWATYGEPRAGRFERLWRGENCSGWRSVPLPEAVEGRFLELLPDDDYVPPPFDPLEPPEPAPAPQPSEADSALVAEIRAAPATRTGVGLASAGVKPWPHQTAIARRIVERWPRSYLLADEVGLGKTIEAGLVLRELLLSGQVNTALLLVPASLLVQWQEELAEKFLLDVPYLDGRNLTYPAGATRPAGAGPDRWRAAPVLLASSHLARRADQRQHLLGGPGWDLVFVDEAHHARRRGSGTHGSGTHGSPNHLLATLEALKDLQMYRALLLATATPLQMDTADLWGLLELFGLPPGWSNGPVAMEYYFKQLQEPFAGRDWDRLRAMFAAQVTAEGSNTDAWTEIESRLGWAAAGRIEGFDTFGLPRSDRSAIPMDERPVWDEWLRANTPVRRRVFRTTRTTLRSYQHDGLLGAETVIPNRHVSDEFLGLGEATALYRRIDDYIARRYDAYMSAGGTSEPLGFIMTVYRRRLTSSFWAVRCSLRRRRDALAGQAEPARLLDDDDLHTLEAQPDLDDLPVDGEGSVTGTGADLAAEIAELDDFIAALDEGPRDEPKMQRLHELIADSLNGGHRTIIVFTQYYDTLDYLRQQLLPTFGEQLICYFGGRGERWSNSTGAWEPLGKEQVKELFRRGVEVRILLGTDSMSEGLNLQTCDRLVNFDLPWNFMRVEQRIGRVDRIGGRPDVYVTNLFYEGTVEDDIYRRIGESHNWFSHVVGNAAPVLAATESVIQRAVMRRGADPQVATSAVDEAVADLGRIIDRLERAPVRVQDLDAVPRHNTPLQPAMTLAQLGERLRHSDALAHRFEPHPHVPGAWLVDIDGHRRAVTFDPQTYQDTGGPELCTWGTPLLASLLDEIASPAPASREASSGTGSGGTGAHCTAPTPNAATTWR